ncbi:MAG TPA: acyl-CoA synthetase [Solirubrobacterales bacterium]|nr:acyl-CoA synthetase [Solirubrobacterales bacterium]
MDATVNGYDWAGAARRAGIGADGAFNSATLRFDQRRALIWRRADGRAEVFSGADLTRLGADLAQALARVGIGPGDRVAAKLGRRPESFALPLALWRLGAIYVPLFSGFGVEAISVRLADSGCAAIVVDAANAASVQGARGAVDGLRVLALGGSVPAAEQDVDLDAALERAPGEPRLHPTAATDPATIMYTSGTTGKPKGCVVPHYGVLTLWPFVEHALAMRSGGVLLSTADAGWSFGLYTTGLAPLSLGATRVIIEGAFDAAEWWRIARELGADHLASAPTGFRQLAAAGTDVLRAEFPTSLRAATSCGEPLTAEVDGWFRENLDFPIYDSYGATELGIVMADLRDPAQDQALLGGMGQVLPGFDVALLDESGEEVEEGIGRVAVRDHGWLLSRGYWDREEVWNERLRDGWWWTEDLVERRAGRYRYVSRADDIIVTAGYNVGPADVEAVLVEHPEITDAACVGVADARKGLVVAAFVVVDPAGEDAGRQERLLEEGRRLVGERIGWHAAPRSIHRVEAIPRTESGKVIRRGFKESA